MRRPMRPMAVPALWLAALIPFSPLASAQAAAPAARPSMPPVCASCHKPEAGVLRGYLEGVAFKSQSLQLSLGGATEIIRFDPNAVKVLDAGDPKKAEHLREVKKNHEARIEIVEKDGVKYAAAIDLKGPIKTPPEKLIAYGEVARLVAQGPEQGGYTLIDSRPLPRFQEGTIPGAINLPYPTFDKFLDRLPKDKSKLLVFFCQGVTCMMSPSSLRRAEAMGYTRVKVYREGWPEWTEKNVGVMSAASLKEAWLDKDIPHVLIDARAPLDNARAHIKGAVSITPEQVKAALKTFPDKKLKAPFMVYDGGDGAAAMAVAKAITAAGYPLVNVIPGGMDAWVKAGYATVAGVPSTQVAYAPKPRPGEIPVTDFQKLAANMPPGVLILDVRNTDEANAGMIKGAKLVPDEEIMARMAEIPKDKRIITHCATGVRAEMAYHKLKAAGYDVGFVKAEIEIARNGALKIKG
ncbi:MAG TPA: rhodanese-like domain-containing protein [Burkholderiaceae bacterium]|nr:rhodanese-like domain-containing protein [Burkholderiaceae bacterium]